MDWKKSSILGHSLGGVIAVEFCACFPELVDSLVVIDSLGPFSAHPEKTVQKLRNAVLEETKYFEKTKSSRIYPTYLDAVNARVRNSVAFSKKPLSVEAAKLLVSRSVQSTHKSANRSM